MKKQRLFKLVALLVLCCAMLGCGKQSEPDPEVTTKIYGTVINENTGEPVQGAEIVFGIFHDVLYGSDTWKRISSSVSGNDGQYEISFGKIPNIEYYERFEIRIEFHSNSYKIPIEVMEGYSHRLDISVNPI